MQGPGRRRILAEGKEKGTIGWKRSKEAGPRGLSTNLGHFSNLELFAGGGAWGRVSLGWVVLAVGFTLVPQPGLVGHTYMKLAIIW